MRSPPCTVTLTVATGQRRIKTLTVYADIDEDDIPTGGGQGGGGDTTDTHTLLSVFKDIILAYTSNSMTDSQAAEYWDSDYLEYGIGIDWGTTSETTLQDALEEAVQYAPEYLTVSEAAHSGTWSDDNSDGWFATLGTEDGGVTVELGTYIDEGYVVLNIEVY